MRAKIYVQEYDTKDWHVFAVHYRSRLWKKLTSQKEDKPPTWIQQVDEGLAVPASEQMIEVLHEIWRSSDELPKPRRFPRYDRETELFLYKQDAKGPQELATQLECLVRMEQKSRLRAGLNWDLVPRFDPSSIEDTRWLVENLLAEGNIHLVFGERGSFKSTFFLCAAKAVAAGEAFLGMKTCPRRVLLLDYENPVNTIKARNDDLGLDLSNNHNLIVWDRFGRQPVPHPDDPILESLVRSCVVETGHGPWIILDSWSSLLRAGEGGEITGQTAPIYRQLRRLADLGATLSVQDHSRKYQPGTIYGSEDKEAKVDSIHNLQTFENPQRPLNTIVRVDSWLKRSAPKGVGSFAFEVQSKKDKDGQWHVEGLALTNDPAEEEKRRNQQMLRDLIRDNPNRGQEYLARLAAQHGYSRDQALQELKAGIGKHWKVEPAAHNRFRFILL